MSSTSGAALEVRPANVMTSVWTAASGEEHWRTGVFALCIPMYTDDLLTSPEMGLVPYFLIHGTILLREKGERKQASFEIPPDARIWINLQKRLDMQSFKSAYCCSDINWVNTFYKRSFKEASFYSQQVKDDSLLRADRILKRLKGQAEIFQRKQQSHIKPD